MSEFGWAECGQCGWLGHLSELRDHPTRPMPMDLGFCPDCGAFVDRPKPTRETIEKRIATNKANGFKQTDNQKQKAREANLKRYLVTFTNGETKEIAGVEDFALEIGVSRDIIRNIACGRTKGLKYNIKSIVVI